MLPTPNYDTNALNAYWQTAAPYVARPIAAGAAIVLPFRFFQQKTELQKTGILIKVPLLNGMKDGLRAAPTLFNLIGSQMIAQKILEGNLHKIWSRKEGEPPSFLTMVASSALVGAATVHPLAVFTGQTQTPKIDWVESMRRVTPKQAGASAWMESCFVLGLRGSEPLCDRVELVFNEDSSGVVKHICSFVSGAWGAALGQPGDTALTLLQSKLPVKMPHLMRGVCRRSVGVGFYAVFYHAIREFIETSSLRLRTSSTKERSI